MRSPLRIDGYAAVSEDGMLANAEGMMPEALKVEADQQFFERGLDLADVLVHGRHSSESGPKVSMRRRLIVTRQVQDITPHPANPKALLWNPQGATLLRALEAIGPPNVNIAVLGGTNVFEMFLDLYATFYLSHIQNVRLPGGRPVFQAVPTRSPEQVLAAHGMKPGANEVSTPTLTITPWRRLDAALRAATV